MDYEVRINIQLFNVFLDENISENIKYIMMKLKVLCKLSHKSSLLVNLHRYTIKNAFRV